MENTLRMDSSRFPQLDKYEILEILGEGGMGYVFLARHRKIDRLVAIKMLHEKLVINPLLRERFKREAALLAKLQHKNIVILYDYEEQPTGLFLIMEYVEGKMMSDILKEKGGFSLEQARKYMFQILDAFSYAHNMGIVHRDIKPSNIMITRSDEIKILDFGIGKIIDDDAKKQDITSTGIRLGTLIYMAPEQLEQGIASPQTDIYSLGLTFFQMLTGEYPYPKDTYTDFQLSMKIVGEEFPPEGHPYQYIPQPIFQVLKKSVNKNPQERFSSCEEFRYALKEAFARANKEPTPKNIIDENSFEDLLFTDTREKKAEDLLVTSQIPARESETAPSKDKKIEKKKKNNNVFFLVLAGFFLIIIVISSILISDVLNKDDSPEGSVTPPQAVIEPVEETIEPLVIIKPQGSEDFEETEERTEENFPRKTIFPFNKKQKKKQEETREENKDNAQEVDKVLSKIEKKLEYGKFSQFLQTDYENKKNFFGKYASSDIKVTNYAPVKYKDIMFSVEFYDKDDVLLNKKTFSFTDEVPANGSMKYRVKYKAPSKTADIRIRVIRANPVY